MLEDVPGLGCWRVDTGSYYAAVELPGVAALLAMAQGAIPGKLVLDQRTVTRQVDGKPQTFNFAEITDRLLEAGAALRVKDGIELGETVVKLFGDSARCRAMGEAAAAAVARERGAVERTMTIVESVAGIA